MLSGGAANEGDGAPKASHIVSAAPCVLVDVPAAPPTLNPAVARVLLHILVSAAEGARTECPATESISAIAS